MPLLQRLPCAYERVPLVVHKALDLQRHLHVASPVEPLSGSAFVRPELRKLRLPESENISFHFANAGHVSNFEVETVRYRGRIDNALVGKLVSHNASKKVLWIPADLTL